MLKRDESLRREFAERLRTDESFAANPRARLRFFFERSPYMDSDLNLYPVARVDALLPRGFDRETPKPFRPRGVRSRN